MQNIYDFYLQSAQGKHPDTFVRTGRGQRGNGIGSFLAGLFRKVFPFIKSGAKALGQEFLSSGIDVVKDNFKGVSLKESVKKRAREAGNKLTERAATKIESMMGNGIKRRRGRKKTHSSTGRRKKRTTKRRKKPVKKTNRLKKKVASKRRKKRSKKRSKKCTDIFK